MKILFSGSQFRLQFLYGQGMSSRRSVLYELPTGCTLCAMSRLPHRLFSPKSILTPPDSRRFYCFFDKIRICCREPKSFWLRSSFPEEPRMTSTIDIMKDRGLVFLLSQKHLGFRSNSDSPRSGARYDIGISTPFPFSPAAASYRHPPRSPIYKITPTNPGASLTFSFPLSRSPLPDRSLLFVSSR